jgi:hypothetical protein
MNGIQIDILQFLSFFIVWHFTGPQSEVILFDINHILELIVIAFVEAVNDFNLIL